MNLDGLEDEVGDLVSDAGLALAAADDADAEDFCRWSRHFKRRSVSFALL